jgi:hypothetical protein
MRQVHPVGNRRIDYCAYVQPCDKGEEIGKAAIGARRAGGARSLRRSEGTAARLRDSCFSGGITIGDVSAGGGDP